MSSVPTLNIARQRLHTQRLAGAPFDRAEDFVRLLGAVQSQDYAGAKWAIAQRSAGIPTDGELDKLFDDGVILRTHILRPTWHFVVPADIRWMLSISGPRVQRTNAHYYRKLELDAAVFRRAHAVMTKALRGCQFLTRAELGQQLKRAGIAASGMRLAYIVMQAELDALICSGPLRGKQFTYALLEERVAQSRVLNRDEALAELARRYFTGHGPAQLQDYTWWSGLTVAEAKAGIAMNGSLLMRETFEGKTYWCGETTPAGSRKLPAIRLLPNYDEYVIAYKDRGSVDSQITDREDNSAPMAHILVLRGQVAGGWRRTISKKDVTISTNRLVAFDEADERALRTECVRYGRFLGKPATLVD